MARIAAMRTALMASPSRGAVEAPYAPRASPRHRAPRSARTASPTERRQGPARRRAGPCRLSVGDAVRALRGARCRGDARGAYGASTAPREGEAMRAVRIAAILAILLAAGGGAY